MEKEPLEVAPLVGAWIETFNRIPRDYPYESHPSWVRGLKPGICDGITLLLVSHPSWVRGLKQSALPTSRR